jgi:hypothetical protein
VMSGCWQLWVRCECSYGGVCGRLVNCSAIDACRYKRLTGVERCPYGVTLHLRTRCSTVSAHQRLFPSGGGFGRSINRNSLPQPDTHLLAYRTSLAQRRYAGHSTPLAVPHPLTVMSSDLGLHRCQPCAGLPCRLATENNHWRECMLTRCMQGDDYVLPTAPEEFEDRRLLRRWYTPSARGSAPWHRGQVSSL